MNRYRAVKATDNYYDPLNVEKRIMELDVWKRKMREEGVIGRPFIVIKEPIARETEDESEQATYSIRLGRAIPYNIPQVQQDIIKGDYPVFRLLGHYKKVYKFPFSWKKDNFGSLQSEHCFFSGLMGQGKTNLSSLFLSDWHRRPNPTISLFVSQKGGVIDNDMKKIKKRLHWGGLNSALIRLGDEQPEGKIPFSVLTPGDVKALFGMSGSGYTKFYGLVQQCKRAGEGIDKATKRFVETREGEKYKEIFIGMGENNYFSMRRRDDLILKRKWTYFLDISKLLRTESETTVDVVLSSWLKYLYQHVTEMRSKASKVFAGKPNMYLNQYQALIVFDEYYELARGLKFKRLVDVVNRIAMQGRQDGMSLVISAQTVRGMGNEKVAIDQASNLFQFKPSSNSDQNFAIRTMGWERSSYELFIRELYNTAFPSMMGDRDVFKGRTILFSKSNGDIAVLQLRLLD